MLGWLIVYMRGLLMPLFDQKGQDLAEYGLLLALIALVAVGAAALLGTQVSRLYSILC